MNCFVSHLSSKHTLLHLLRDDVNRLIKTVLSEPKRSNDDARVTLCTAGENRETGLLLCEHFTRNHLSTDEISEKEAKKG